MVLKHSVRALVVVSAVTVMTLAPSAFADDFGTGENAFTIDFVSISSGSNPTPAQTRAGKLDGFGIVEYDYRIGVYEITNDQWNKFKAEVGVPVTGNPTHAYINDFYEYDTGVVDVPTNNVSWYEVAQFVNWLNTSTGHHPAYKFTGTQGQSDYTFATWDALEAWGGTNLYRHEDAYYFLPDEDEWFKAAYWSGTAIQYYATKIGDTLHQGDGVSGTGWNYYHSGCATDPPGPWDVGSGSEELNGTYDMMGNNVEWVESPYNDPTYAPGSSRSLLGGYWATDSGHLHAFFRTNSNPENDTYHRGFRVASIPEPGGITLLVYGLLAGLLWRRR